MSHIRRTEPPSTRSPPIRAYRAAVLSDFAIRERCYGGDFFFFSAVTSPTTTEIAALRVFLRWNSNISNGVIIYTADDHGDTSRFGYFQTLRIGAPVCRIVFFSFFSPSTRPLYYVTFSRSIDYCRRQLLKLCIVFMHSSSGTGVVVVSLLFPII